MLSGLPWMQPPPQGKPSDSGKKPQKQTLHVHIAAGVFGETLNYKRRAKIRPELSCPTISNSFGWGSDEKPNDLSGKTKTPPKYLRWYGRRRC